MWFRDQGTCSLIKIIGQCSHTFKTTFNKQSKKGQNYNGIIIQQALNDDLCVVIREVATVCLGPRSSETGKFCQQGTDGCFGLLVSFP